MPATLGPAALRDARRPTLSQGRRGRTLIARALMPEPRLLLLDEPATGLDLPGREQLIEALQELRPTRPRPATVLVTHHLEELPAGTTHALLLRDGRCLAQGPVSQVLTGDRVGACFDLPPALERHEGRWSGADPARRMTKGVPLPSGRAPPTTRVTCSGRPRTRRTTAPCRR
ncbi:ATP-binding cassette domain-containing protein [Streptomyces sp. NPDC051133]|uniref:ATP-binding cassette domain-containing protein n=1 Tax=Streptomyces sp. NPDC051133 TaxID=3155521 RepID=UPI003438E11E